MSTLCGHSSEQLFLQILCYVQNLIGEIVLPIEKKQLLYSGNFTLLKNSFKTRLLTVPNSQG